MLIFIEKSKFYKVFLIFIFLFFNNNLKANIIRDAEIENFLTEMANPIFEAANIYLMTKLLMPLWLVVKKFLLIQALYSHLKIHQCLEVF